MLTLRYYQEDAVQSLFRFFYEVPEGNPLVALPTGTGKSLVIAAFIYRVLTQWPGQRFMVLTHDKKLIQQDHDELVALWPTAPVGIYSAGLKRRDNHFPITFCGIQSVAKKTHIFGHIDIAIVDEAHLVNDKEGTNYAKAFAALKRINPRLRIIGLSATIYRMGLGLLTEGSIFTHVVCDWTSFEKFNQLMDDGFICDLVPKKTALEIDFSDLSSRGGDYVQEEVEAVFDRDEVLRPMLDEIALYCTDRKSWLCFASGKKHCDHIAEAMCRRGWPALSVHSGKSDDENDRAFAAFKRGEIACLVNYGKATTGFNHKPVDLIIVARKTKSAALWVQILGRGTRPCNDWIVCPGWIKPNCLVLDFARNSEELGPINDPKLPKPKGKKGPSAAPYKICPACNTYNHPRAAFCKYCYAEFPKHLELELKASEAELIRRKKEAVPIEIETFTVDTVSYRKHIPRSGDKPPSLLVTYWCGLRQFTEYLSLENPVPYVRHMARDRWRSFLKTSENDSLVPETVDEALDYLDRLAKPETVKVELGKFPKILDYSFDRSI